MLKSFVDCSDPNQGSSDDIPAYWPEYSIDNQHYLDFNTSITDSGDDAVGYSFRREYSVFWSRMVPQIYGSKKGVCDEVVINEYERPNAMQLKWKPSQYTRPTFALESPSADDLLNMNAQSPQTRDTTACEGSGEFIRSTG